MCKGIFGVALATLLATSSAHGANRNDATIASWVQFSIGALIFSEGSAIKKTVSSRSVQELKERIKLVDEDLSAIQSRINPDGSREIADLKERIAEAKRDRARAAAAQKGFGADSDFYSLDFDNVGDAVEAEALAESEVALLQEEMREVEARMGQAPAVSDAVKAELAEQEASLLKTRNDLRTKLAGAIGEPDQVVTVRKFSFFKKIGGGLLILDAGIKAYCLVTTDDQDISIFPLVDIAKKLVNQNY